VDAGNNAVGRCNSSTGFDALNRPLRKTYAGGAGAISEVTFGYGENLREAGDALPTFVKGRLTSVDNGSGKVMYRRIDAMGWPAAVSGAAGMIAAVATGVTDPVGGAQLAPYAPHGGMQVLVYGASGHTQFMRYNDLLQVQRIQVTGANAWRLDYDWGPSGKNNGNLRTQTINSGIAQVYEYDRLDRLVKTTEGSWTQRNVYDRYGNRAVLASEAGPYSLTGMTPQVTSATEAAVEAVYPSANRWNSATPDGSGNITAINGQVLEYDAENRMTRAVVNGTTTGYGYDGEGKRVWKAVCAGVAPVCKPSTTGASWTTFVYDAGGALAAEYASAADGEPAGRKYLVADHLGSTRMTFGAGYATKRYDYMPFGEAIGAGVNGRGSEYAQVEEKVRFTGQIRDFETGLDYFGARYYGSAHGRFLGVDPDNAAGRVEDPQSWNGYSYVRNSPLVLVDPDGEDYQVCGGGGCGNYSNPDFLSHAMSLAQANYRFVGNEQAGQILTQDGVFFRGYHYFFNKDAERVSLFAASMKVHLDHYVRETVRDGVMTYAGGAVGGLTARFVVAPLLARIAANRAAQAVAGEVTGLVVQAAQTAGNRGALASSKAVALQAAEEWVGIGARPIVRRGSGEVIGKISANGERIYRTTSLGKAEPYVNLESKVSGGNLHVRF
jgi:RHS repeat-associated protein